MYHLRNAARWTLWLVLQSWPPVLHTQLPAQTHSCEHQEAPSKATVLRQLSSEKKFGMHGRQWLRARSVWGTSQLAHCQLRSMSIHSILCWDAASSAVTVGCCLRRIDFVQ